MYASSSARMEACSCSVSLFDSVVGLDAAAAAFSGSCTAGVSVMRAGAYLFKTRNLSFLSSKRAGWLAEVKEMQMSRWTKTRATMVVHQNAVTIGRVPRTLRILFRTETILTTFA